MTNQAAGDSGTNNHGDGGIMNSINDEEVNIWSRLPEDVLDRIFSCLPLTSILRLRCVCKRWNSLVQSKRFQTALAKVSSPRPWFILCTMGRPSCCYDPGMNKWHIIIRPPNNGRSLLSPCTSILAVSGSLLCLGNQVSECKNLSICNPITRSRRNLPRMLQVSLIHRAPTNHRTEEVGESVSLPFWHLTHFSLRGFSPTVCSWFSPAEKISSWVPPTEKISSWVPSTEKISYFSPLCC